jgi:hypothetical protein
LTCDGESVLMSEDFDEVAALSLIGKYVVVGVNYTDQNGELVEQKQFHGRVVRANAREGVVLIQPSGDEMKLPPFLRAFQPARPGEYRLRSTGEVVANPDYTCTWSVTRDPVD